MKLVDNQLQEDLQRFEEESYHGMNRYMKEADREHRRVHDMQYLCQLKTRLWADAIKNVFQQRFFQGMCCGILMISGTHVVLNIVKWFLSK